MQRRWAVAGILFACAVPLGGYAGEKSPGTMAVPFHDDCKNRNRATGVCPQEEGGVWRELLKFSVSGNFMQPPKQLSATK